MRLDLFLKQTGLIKRRPVAKEMCDAGKIERNGRVARAADDVREGDTLLIRYGVKTLEAQIVEVPRGNVAKAARADFYRVVREDRLENDIHSIVNRPGEHLNDEEDGDGLKGPLF